MKKILMLIALIMTNCVFCAAEEVTYTENWESLDSRPLPQWYDDAKFGIFIHWGVYSIPSHAQGAEWYINHLKDGGSGTLTSLMKYANKYEETELQKFHKKMYGKNFKYEDFAPMFKAEFYDPAAWANLFSKAGAKYVVLTSKHHDGFCMWPAPDSKNWNSVDTGPKRDLAGELSVAVKAAGMKMGFYYSQLEWYHPLYVKNIGRYVDEHLIPQLEDLVNKYEPSLLWGDGEWDYSSKILKTDKFVTWLYNESPVRDEIVINDRWGQDTRSVYGGFLTSEIGNGALFREIDFSRKWEECNTIAGSWGYVRNANYASVNSTEKLIHNLVDIVSRGGNYLLNVGPTPEGTIPLIQQDRLLEIGKWLSVNGEAIYGTRKWRETTEGEFIKYTTKGNDVYAIVLKWPGDSLELNAPEPGKDTKVSMLGLTGELNWTHENGVLKIVVPKLSVDEVPARYAYVFKITDTK